jgi:hypothetical protein
MHELNYCVYVSELTMSFEQSSFKFEGIYISELMFESLCVN